MKQETIVPMEEKKRRVRSTLANFAVAVDRTDAAGTSFAGLPLAVEAFHQLGLPGAIKRHLKLKQRARGPSESNWVETFTMLLLAGGESLDDLDTLKNDQGLKRIWSVPQEMSPRSALHFLYRFHDPEAPEAVQGKAVIRAETPGLLGLSAVNQHLVAEIQRRAPSKRATLDVDASVHECHKRQALFSYEHCRAYQPVVAVWAEQDVVVLDQFRDGNVPAGMGNREFLERAFAALPDGVEEKLLRADTALYEHEVLRWADRNGVQFAISADMSQALRTVAEAVPEKEWKELRNRDGILKEAGKKWAEVEFFPDDDCARKGERPFRYLAIRVPQEPDLYGEQEKYRYFAVVTNRDLPGEELINWHREKCGTVEHVHDRLKNDAGARTFPSGYFGANAAWYRLAILASNLATAIQRLALKGEWAGIRLSTFRYRFLRLGGRVVKHARRLLLVLATATTELATLYVAARDALASAAEP